MQDADKSVETDKEPSQEVPENPINQMTIKLPIKEPRSGRKLAAIIFLIVVSIASIAGFVLYMVSTYHAPEEDKSSSFVSGSSTPEASADTDGLDEGLKLDPDKNYGNKYSDGILPVGDDKYVTNAAKKGYIYACSQYAQNLNGGGADTRGPWFVNGNKEYDLNKKISVQGSKSWKGEFSNKIADTVRTITTNDLPLSHSTGTFPISSSDPAYSYDKNPNSISTQDLTYKLDASPVYGEPQCMGGEVGVMLTGVSIFNGFDAGARDAGAWEIQDSCEGHPQVTGQYHYHTLSSCINDIGVGTVIGFALDGFPITGPKVGTKNFLTTSDLDECHGIVSEVKLDGKNVTTYHYVMTQDFPYSVSCFRSDAAESSGTKEGQSSGGQSAQPNGGQNVPPPSGGTPPPQH